MASQQPPQNDRELMRWAQAGDRGAFTQLVGRYEAALLRVAESRVGRRDWAEDIVQETLLAAFKSRATFDLGGNFRAWLWTILFNQCSRHYHRRRRAQLVEGLEGDRRGVKKEECPESLECLEPGPHESMLVEERRLLLEACLGDLSPAQADALRLRFYGGLKFREIAETTGCSLATAKNRVRSGLLRMAEIIEAKAAGSTSDFEGMP